MDDLSYVNLLKKSLAASRQAKKVDRTRIRLLIAAAQIIAERGVDALTVAEVTQAAGLAHGTFYRYFKNTRAIVFAVFAGLTKSVRDRRPAIEAVDKYERIRDRNLYYTDFFRQNAGLMRTYVRLKVEDPEFAELGQAADRWLAERVLADLAAGPGNTVAAPPDMQRLAIYAVMGMVDELLRKIFCGSDETVTDFGRDIEKIAEVLTLIWWRALYGGSASEAPGESVLGVDRRQPA